MEFCSSCGSILAPRKGKLMCACGNSQKLLKRKFSELLEREDIEGVVDESIHPLATFDHVCSKCGFGRARLVSKGIFISDEDEAVEYICGKCGHHQQGEGLKVT